VPRWRSRNANGRGSWPRSGRSTSSLRPCRVQQRDLREHDYFDVRGSRGGVYRICRGQVRNVLALVDGRPLNRLCAHPQRERVPDADAMLAQALMLQTDEGGFTAIANVEGY